MIGLTTMKTFAMAALFAAASLAATFGAAQAATVSSTCPDSGTWDRTFTLSSSDADVGSIDCYAWGAGPAIHESDLTDQLTADGYVYSGTVSNVNPAGDVSGFEDLYSLLGDNGGSFDTTGSYEAVLIFKVGPEACPSKTVPGLLCLPALIPAKRPSKPTVSPRAICSATPCRMWLEPYQALMPWASRITSRLIHVLPGKPPGLQRCCAQSPACRLCIKL